MDGLRTRFDRLVELSARGNQGRSHFEGSPDGTHNHPQLARPLYYSLDRIVGKRRLGAFVRGKVNGVPMTDSTHLPDDRVRGKRAFKRLLKVFAVRLCSRDEVVAFLDGDDAICGGTSCGVTTESVNV